MPIGSGDVRAKPPLGKIAATGPPVRSLQLYSPLNLAPRKKRRNREALPATPRRLRDLLGAPKKHKNTQHTRSRLVAKTDEGPAREVLNDAETCPELMFVLMIAPAPHNGREK